MGYVSLHPLGAGSTPGLLETPEPKTEGSLQTKFGLARDGCPARRLEVASATKRALCDGRGSAPTPGGCLDCGEALATEELPSG